MEMTDGERLIALMLADLMIGMDISGEIDPNAVKRHVINNDMWALKLAHGSIFDNDDPVAEEVVDETANILSMFTYIKYSLDKLPADQKAEFDDNPKASFRGFDGNNDPHHGVAHTLINDLGRFGEYEGAPLNSHSRASLPQYRATMEVYDQVFPETVDGLSYDQLKAVLG